MWTRHHKKRKLGRLVLPLIAVAFLSYFGYHSVHGGYGLKATEQFDRQIVERQARLDELTKQRTTLEREVQLMSDGSLERDMLDEKARLALNMSRSDEIVIFHRMTN
ncbi:FtsB family cell division protein [Ensifer sp.]|uniref:FtsB family cell division protein n=1 Tax=Ensifer sp. TaxID=1872086 RepID=UPI000DD711AE|nr:septum formation initiator family protein [Ensifer sp.]